MLLAVDGSTVSTGFAFGGVSDGVPRGGVWKLPGAEEHVFDRTLRLAGDSLTEFARVIQAERVVIEAPLLLIDREHSRDAAAALIQLTGALRAGASRAGCKVTLIGVGPVRKTFIGRSDLPRADAKRAVMGRCRQLGWPITNGDGKDDDNRADANALWFWGMARFYKGWNPKVARQGAA